MSLKIANQQPGRLGTARVALEGSLDSETSPQLESYLEKVIDESITTLTLDLKELRFISSAGLRVIVKAQKTLTAQRGEVLMLHLQPQIRKVFEIVKALPSLAVFADEQEMDDYLETMQARASEQGE